METELKVLVDKLVKEVLEHDFYPPASETNVADHMRWQGQEEHEKTNTEMTDLAQVEAELIKFFSKKLADYMTQMYSEHNQDFDRHKAKQALPEIIWDLYERREIPNMENENVANTVKQLEREQHGDLPEKIVHEAFKLYRKNLQLGIV